MQSRKRQQLPGYFPALQRGCGRREAQGISARCPPTVRRRSALFAGTLGTTASPSSEWRTESQAQTPYSVLPHGLSADSEQ